MPRDLFAQPLFSPKLIKSRFAAAPIPSAHLAIISEWAQALKGSLGKDKEESVRPVFLQRFFVDILGYQLKGGPVWTLVHENKAAFGSVDAALGVFTHELNQVVAPFELKGPRTTNLEALMPGRHKSPVQQAWEYANDLPGSQFVLVSNCDEVRLYALGYGRAVYESWHVTDLLEPAHYASFVGLLHAERLVNGLTQTLLKESALQEREITQALYLDYKTLRQELMVGLHHLNPQVVFADLIRHAQKLIDRLLFIAFAESRNLLPKGSIKKAAEHIDPYNPQPRWINFRALFTAVDKGNPFLQIPPYNGGLFSLDVALDALIVSDKLVARFTALSGYDYEDEVSVTVLGRIFEQSVSDLERIADAGDISTFTLSGAPADTKAKTSKSVDGKRKRDGVVYTPDHITRFIVEQTLQPVIIEQFFQVHSRYFVNGPTGGNWRPATKDEKLRTLKSVAPQNITEYQFYLAWQTQLTALRVCDPACGSGAFLVAAFDVLREAYAQLHYKLRELAPEELLNVDISHEILQNNLFGVDINAESIEITKLSLWLKTAERGRQLAGLDSNFYQGNSLVANSAVDALAFDWQGRMAPQPVDGVAPAAGFDVILGNPPYVRQELFTSLKPYLEAHYQTFHGVADLYVYFYELGLKLLRPGGRLGFISSSSFFKTSSGEPLRRLLRQQCHIEALVDFGDWQVFEGVTTYPAVVVVKALDENAAPDAGSQSAHFLQLTAPVPDLIAHFAENKQMLDLAQLGPLASPAASAARQPAPEWQLEGAEASALRERLTTGHPTLKQTVGAPLYGIKTGLNEAFVIDRATRDRLVYADIASEPLFKPFLEGKDIKRWQVESEDRWLILLPKGWTRATFNNAIDEATAWDALQKRHPPLAAWLAPFADAARKRTDQGDYWWELRACGYYDKFEAVKIYYPDICVAPNFFFDQAGAYSGNTTYFLPAVDEWFVALLNSKTTWFLINGLSTHIRGGYLRMFTQHIQTLPVPAATPAQQAELTALAQAAQQTAKERLAEQRNFGRRILDLLPSPPPKGAQASLGDKLGAWWLLPDFKAFSFEVSKRFKTDIPLRQRNDWEQLFTQGRTRVHQLSANIAAAERSIDVVVYELFGLSPTEMTLIERSVPR